jgi:polar amino acid transport system substrate-binding protein
VHICARGVQRSRGLRVGFLSVLLCIFFALAVGKAVEGKALRRSGEPLRVGVAGTEPFVVFKNSVMEGVSVEIWQALAAQAGWSYSLNYYDNVPKALDALTDGEIDVVIGPISITAERARYARFSQPYFQSSLSIMSRTEQPTIWERFVAFFNKSFLVAAGILLFILALVGTLIWLAERRAPMAPFPHKAVRGIASGVWFAIVTMSTVGYGDIAPKTLLGRLVTGIWIIVSVIAATSLVAGIASALTLFGMRMTSIATAEQLSGRSVAVVADSPGEAFAERYGARLVDIGSLEEGYKLLKNRNVDALVFDRPQLLYFLKSKPDQSVAVSSAEYMRQNYGFALPLASRLLHTMNVNLLLLQESGRVDRIIRGWLGADIQ